MAVKQPVDVSDEEFRVIQGFAEAKAFGDARYRDETMREQLAAIRALALGAPHGVTADAFASRAREAERLYGLDFDRRRRYVEDALAYPEHFRGALSLASSLQKPVDVGDDDFRAIQALAEAYALGDASAFDMHVRAQLEAVRQLALGAPAGVRTDTFERLARTAADVFGADFEARWTYVEMSLLALPSEDEPVPEEEAVEAPPEDDAIERDARPPAPREGFDALMKALPSCFTVFVVATLCLVASMLVCVLS